MFEWGRLVWNWPQVLCDNNMVKIVNRCKKCGKYFFEILETNTATSVPDYCKEHLAYEEMEKYEHQ